MDEIVVSGARALTAVARWLAVELAWHLLPFNLGRAALWLSTLGRLPTRGQLHRYPDRIALVGVLVLLCAWLSVVGVTLGR